MTTLKKSPIISDEFRRLDPYAQSENQNPNPDELMIEVDLCYELDRMN